MLCISFFVVNSWDVFVGPWQFCCWWEHLKVYCFDVYSVECFRCRTIENNAFIWGTRSPLYFICNHGDQSLHQSVCHRRPEMKSVPRLKDVIVTNKSKVCQKKLINNLSLNMIRFALLQQEPCQTRPHPDVGVWSQHFRPDQFLYKNLCLNCSGLHVAIRMNSSLSQPLCSVFIMKPL